MPVVAPGRGPRGLAFRGRVLGCAIAIGQDRGHRQSAELRPSSDAPRVPTASGRSEVRWSPSGPQSKIQARTRTTGNPTIAATITAVTTHWGPFRFGTTTSENSMAAHAATRYTAAVCGT
jgi:hypothetical protein